MVPFCFYISINLNCGIVRTLHQTEAGRLVVGHKIDLDSQPSIERKKTMASHSSASPREHTPRTINSITTMGDALRRRAESVINDKSIDSGSRAIIRYALEINDPMLAELVQWADP